jgi:hypothetical protein
MLEQEETLSRVQIHDGRHNREDEVVYEHHTHFETLHVP